MPQREPEWLVGDWVNTPAGPGRIIAHASDHSVMVKLYYGRIEWFHPSELNKP